MAHRLVSLEQAILQLTEKVQTLESNHERERDDGRQAMNSNPDSESLAGQNNGYDDYDDDLPQPPGQVVSPVEPEDHATYSPFLADELERAIKKFHRCKNSFEKAQASYKIDSIMSIGKLFEMQAHNTPFTFAPLPEKDVHTFHNWQLAAEDLEPMLEHWLSFTGNRNDSHYTDYAALANEVKIVIDMEDPSTGNRLLDFIDQIGR